MMQAFFDYYIWKTQRNFLLTIVAQMFIILMGHICEEVLTLPPPKKMGRPTDNPKRHEIKARIDDGTFEVLNKYCKEKGKSKAEGIRDGINKLKSDITEK